MDNHENSCNDVIEIKCIAKMSRVRRESENVWQHFTALEQIKVETHVGKSGIVIES